MKLKIPANSYWILEEYLFEQRDLTNEFDPVLLDQRLLDKAKLIVLGKLVEVNNV